MIKFPSSSTEYSTLNSVFNSSSISESEKTKNNGPFNIAVGKDLSKSIERYKNQDTWNETTMLTEESFNHLEDIMIMAKELDSKVPYNDLVDNTYN